MKKTFLLGMLLCLGVSAAFGQKSPVTVFGVPLGSNYEDYLSVFREKGFTGNIYVYEGSTDIEISAIYGTFMTYECYIEMRATKLTHSVYQIVISFSLNHQYEDIPGIEQCRTIVSMFESRYGKATLKRVTKPVQNFEDSSLAEWHLDDNIDIKLLYRLFDDCILTYGGQTALNGLYQQEVEQYNQQKAIEIQEKLSGSDF